jgi:hypothetical protein
MVRFGYGEIAARQYGRARICRLKVAQAYRWGIKAARAGMSPASNPCRNPVTRAAWEAGYASERRDIVTPSDVV